MGKLKEDAEETVRWQGMMENKRMGPRIEKEKGGDSGMTRDRKEHKGPW